MFLINSVIVQGFPTTRVHIALWADFHFLQDRVNAAWQTDLFGHENHRSIIAFVDLCFVFEK